MKGECENITWLTPAENQTRMSPRSSGDFLNMLKKAGLLTRRDGQNSDLNQEAVA